MTEFRSLTAAFNRVMKKLRVTVWTVCYFDKFANVSFPTFGTHHSFFSWVWSSGETNMRVVWARDESCIRVEWIDSDESFVQFSCVRSNENESCMRVEWTDLDESFVQLSCAWSSEVRVDKGHSTNVWNSHRIKFHWNYENVQSWTQRSRCDEKAQKLESWQSNDSNRLSFDPGIMSTNASILLCDVRKTTTHIWQAVQWLYWENTHMIVQLKLNDM